MYEIDPKSCGSEDPGKILFVTVLQNGKNVFECQEYQTLDSTLETLDLQIVCRQLVQPYERGIGT